jgi:steroid 5-alpha reductase family enzyme
VGAGENRSGGGGLIPDQLWIGALAVAALMLILWLLHFPMHNAAIVDVGWAGGLALLGALYAAIGDGWETRRVAIGAMTVIWGLRLALYLLFTRVIGHPEEGRYVQLRHNWKTNIPLRFLFFFEFQAILCVVLSAPFLLSSGNATPAFSALEYAGMAIWVIAIAGEITADQQLKRFKADPANRGKTCRVGLWNLSRHPNYFFEWLTWIGFALFALPAPYGYIGLLSPALILFFLLKLTGIPPTEAQALRSRGDEYRRYQKTTSAFVPWFPKRS